MLHASQRNSPEGGNEKHTTGSLMDVYIPSQGVDGSHLQGSRAQYMIQEGYRMRTSFLQEAKQHYLLNGTGDLQQIKCPVRIMHGIADTSVSPKVSQRLFEELPPGDHALTLLQVGVIAS